KREQTKVRPAETVEHAARDDADERDAGEKELGGERAADEDSKARDNDREPHRRWLTHGRSKLLALTPREHQRQRRNHPSMRIGRVVSPLSRQPDEHRPVYPGESARPGGETEHLRPVAPRSPADDRKAAQAQAEQQEARGLGIRSRRRRRAYRTR